MDFSKLKIVVVEDSPDLRQLWDIVFQRAGITAVFFSTGSQALELVRSGHAPDIVMSDLNLPDMSGDQLIETLRGLCSAKFLIVTGERDYQPPPDVAKLVKPAGMQQLLDEIKKLASSK